MSAAPNPSCNCPSRIICDSLCPDKILPQTLSGVIRDSGNSVVWTATMEFSRNGREDPEASWFGQGLFWGVAPFSVQLFCAGGAHYIEYGGQSAQGDFAADSIGCGPFQWTSEPKVIFSDVDPFVFTAS